MIADYPLQDVILCVSAVMLYCLGVHTGLRAI